MAPTVTVTKTFRFEAAHMLPDHPGQCARMHGHSYVLEVSVRGPVRENGMVVDFEELSAAVRRLVIDRLDHTLLNEVLPNPTAENVGLLILGWLGRAGFLVSELTLHETATSRVAITA